jgi:hypothetical protein
MKEGRTKNNISGNKNRVKKGEVRLMNYNNPEFESLHKGRARNNVRDASSTYQDEAKGRVGIDKRYTVDK